TTSICRRIKISQLSCSVSPRAPGCKRRCRLKGSSKPRNSPAQDRERRERQRGKKGAGEKGAVGADHVPERACYAARQQHGNAREQIEHSKSRAAQFRR